MKYKLNTRYKKILADLYTPVSIYNKVRDRFPNALLLESADYHDRTDSKSFICLEPIAGFEAKGNVYHYNLPNEETQTANVNHSREVFSAFQSFVSNFENTATELPFNTQGLWGYSSFESVQYMEDIEFNFPHNDLKETQI